MMRHRHASAPWPPATPDRAAHSVHATEPGTAAASGWAPRLWNAVGPAESACCCSASPAVQAVLRPAADRAPVELLFCCHHFRASRAALITRDAVFFDVHGAPIEPDADVPVRLAPEPLYP